MSKIKNGGLDQYGAGPFEQQQFVTAGVEGVNMNQLSMSEIMAYTINSNNCCVSFLLLLQSGTAVCTLQYLNKGFIDIRLRPGISTSLVVVG